jgi:hypothetical protein
VTSSTGDGTPGFHPGEREVQGRFDTVRLADRMAELSHRSFISEDDRAYIEDRDMFFLATGDAQGNMDCSYKGGDPGFVRVLDDRTVAFPSYDGNGKFQSAGNIRTNPKVGLLFIDWQGQSRMRLNGTATIDFDDPLTSEFPGAQFVVRVRVEEVFPNCPRYIHRMELVERSAFVPRAKVETPDAGWKEYFEDVLPEAERARRAGKQDGG